MQQHLSSHVWTLCAWAKGTLEQIHVYLSFRLSILKAFKNLIYHVYRHKMKFDMNNKVLLIFLRLLLLESMFLQHIVSFYVLL